MSNIEGKEPGKAGINEMGVTGEGRGLINSTSQSEIEHESEENGTAYSWASDAINPGTGDDTVLLVKNTSDTPLHIETVTISGSTTSEYTIHLPTTEVTVTGTTVTGVNLNTGSVNVADASAASTETNNSQGDVLESIFVIADTTITILTPGLIIGKNKSVGVDVVANTTLSSVTIRGHYAD